MLILDRSELCLKLREINCSLVSMDPFKISWIKRDGSSLAHNLACFAGEKATAGVLVQSIPKAVWDGVKSECNMCYSTS